MKIDSPTIQGSLTSGSVMDSISITNSIASGSFSGSFQGDGSGLTGVGGGTQKFIFQNTFALVSTNTTSWIGIDVRDPAVSGYNIDFFSSNRSSGVLKTNSAITMTSSVLNDFKPIFCSPFNMDIDLIQVAFGVRANEVSTISFFVVKWDDTDYLNIADVRIIYENLSLSMPSSTPGTSIAILDINSFSSIRLNKGDHLYFFHSCTGVNVISPTNIYLEATPV